MANQAETYQIDWKHHEALKAAFEQSLQAEKWAVARQNIMIGSIVIYALLLFLWVVLFYAVVSTPVLTAVIGISTFVLVVAVAVAYVMFQQSHQANRATLEDALRFDVTGAVNDALGQLLLDCVSDLRELDDTITYGEKLVEGVELLTARRANLQRRITSLSGEMSLQEAIRKMVAEAMGHDPLQQNIGQVTRFLTVHSSPLEPLARIVPADKAVTAAK